MKFYSLYFSNLAKIYSSSLLTKLHSSLIFRNIFQVVSFGEKRAPHKYSQFIENKLWQEQLYFEAHNQ